MSGAGRGGFPWGWLLVAGGAVYLYRTNASVREQVDGVLARLNPGVQGNVTRAGDAAKQALGSALQGKNPSDAAQDAAGELKRAGEKGLDHVKDRVEDLKKNDDLGR